VNQASLLPHLINSRRLKDEHERAGGVVAAAAPISEAFSEDLHIVVSVDREGHRDFVRWAEVPRTSDEYLDVIGTALMNFSDSLPTDEPSFVQSASGLIREIAYENTENSLLLVVGKFWRRVFVHCSGDVLAGAPTKGVLYIANAAVPGARQELQAKVNEVFALSKDPLSNRLVSFNGLGWDDES
jgi:hypothetical protein